MNKRKKWDITKHVIDNSTVTSQLVISDLQVKQHNGTYICEVHNNKVSSVRQNTIVVVESESV